MIVGILKEPSGENRVSLLPDQAEVLLNKKVQVMVEAGAGVNAFTNDELYLAKGAIIASRQEVLSKSDVLLSIQMLTDSDLQNVDSSTVLLGIYQPLFNASIIQMWSDQKLTTFSMDMIPVSYTHLTLPTT